MPISSSGNFIQWLLRSGLGFTILSLFAVSELGLYPTISLRFLQRLPRYLRQPAILLFVRDNDMNQLFFLGGAEVMDNDTSNKILAANRRTPPPSDTKSPLSSGGPSSPKMPPPSEHISSPASAVNPNRFSCPSSVSSPSTHSRSKSSIDSVRHGKRLSLSFPVLPSPINTTGKPPSWTATPVLSPEIPPTPTSGNILVALAAQERRVLELREELSRAEANLKELKRHWANHEAMQKRNDMRRIQQLQPLNTALASMAAEEDEDGSNAWMQQEMERRKAMLKLQSSKGKKFAGGRHQRTLTLSSLNSPDKGTYTPSFPQPDDLRTSLEEARKPPLARASTTNDIATTILDSNEDNKPQLPNIDLPSIQREALLRTGKQMANDFKDGLMTFIEDLRQATVGDDAVQGQNGQKASGTSTPQRKNAPGALKTGKRPVSFAGTTKASSKRPPSPALIDIGGSFWKEHGLEEPQANEAKKITKPAAKSNKTGAKPAPPPTETPVKKSVKDFEDSWDTWDTPNDKYVSSSGSEEDSASEPDSEANSRHSTSSNGTLPTEPATPASTKRDSSSITWPAIVKGMSPGHFKRTASNLLNEWEKNLMSGPNAEEIQADAGLAYGSKPPTRANSVKAKKGD